jgi:Poly-beta-hydroxybutyrate polymerase (PhaC) N-terminus
MAPRDAARIGFIALEILDMMSPSNVPWLNPVIVDRTVREAGANLVRGAVNLSDDMSHTLSMDQGNAADGLRIGTDIAARPGEVIFRNGLIELIQYRPGTDSIIGKPILIIPAWIMKYYVLDLRRQNSLLHYLVERGFAVFMISWRNLTAVDRIFLLMIVERRVCQRRSTLSIQWFRAARSTHAAIASAAHCLRSLPQPWLATTMTALRRSHCSRPKPTLARPAS